MAFLPASRATISTNGRFLLWDRRTPFSKPLYFFVNFTMYVEGLVVGNMSRGLLASSLTILEIFNSTGYWRFRLYSPVVRSSTKLCVKAIV